MGKRIRSMGLALLVVVVIGAVLVVFPATPAAACSCLPDPFVSAAADPGRHVAVAVITANSLEGPSLIDRAQDRVNPPDSEDNDPDPGTPYSVWTFHVDQVIDGALDGDLVDIYAPEQFDLGVSAGNCSLGIHLDDQIAAEVFRRDGRLWSSWCSIGSPEDAAAAFGVQLEIAETDPGAETAIDTAEPPSEEGRFGPIGSSTAIALLVAALVGVIVAIRINKKRIDKESTLSLK